MMTSGSDRSSRAAVIVGRSRSATACSMTWMACSWVVSVIGAPYGRSGPWLVLLGAQPPAQPEQAQVDEHREVAEELRVEQLEELHHEQLDEQGDLEDPQRALSGPGAPDEQGDEHDDHRGHGEPQVDEVAR